MFDKKPVIMKSWYPDLDLLAETVKVVPTWIRLPCLPLKYLGQVALNKIATVVGKPIRTERATAEKDIIEYARVLVEVTLEQKFPEEIQFVNEKGHTMTEKVNYECNPIYCGGIGHTLEECKRKKYELALNKVKPRHMWVAKPRVHPVFHARKAIPEPGGIKMCKGMVLM